jgi:hypothetical protein
MKATSFLYLIKLYNDKETFFKIGISVHKYCRFYQLMKFGYKCKIIYMLCGNDYSQFLLLEEYLHLEYSSKSYNPMTKFGGYRECYINIIQKEYINLLRRIYPVNIPIIKNLEISWR